MMKKRTRLIALLVGVAILVSAFEASSVAAKQAARPKPKPRHGGTLVIGLPGDLQTTDPTFGSDGNSDYIFRQVMEGLVGLSPSGKVMPSLATKWTVSPSGKIYSFTLRSRVKFHDGTPFNAAAVKYNFDRWQNLPKATQALASRYPRVFGGFGSQSNIVSVTTKGAKKVVIRLRKASSDFLRILTLSSFTISSPKALQQGDANNPNLQDNRYANGGPPAMVGTGPFKFAGWVRKDHVTLVANKQYWGGRPFLNALKIVPITDDTTALTALQAGDVDFLLDVSPQDLATIRRNKTLRIVERGKPCNTFTINMNVTYPPLNNKDIRLAIAYALDRKAYIQAFYAGQAELADNYGPSWLPYWIPLGIPKYNPAKARQLIKASGVQSPKLDFWYPSNVTRAYMPDPKGIFEAMSRDLEAVGFQVVPHTEGWTTGYLADRSAGKLPMWLFGNFCDFPSLSYMYSFGWFGANQPNGVRTETGFGTPVLANSMAKALAAPSAKAATADWIAVQKMIKGAFPMVPILHAFTPGADNRHVMGFVPSGVQAESFAKVWLSR